MIDYDVTTNRYTVTLTVQGVETSYTFDRSKFMCSEREGLATLVEGIQASIDHIEMFPPEDT